MSPGGTDVPTGTKIGAPWYYSFGFCGHKTRRGVDPAEKHVRAVSYTLLIKDKLSLPVSGTPSLSE